MSQQSIEQRASLMTESSLLRAPLNAIDIHQTHKFEQNESPDAS